MEMNVFDIDVDEIKDDDDVLISLEKVCMKEVCVFCFCCK